ncbi:MAG: CarD family transcriptional regulator [Eubacterium sp.]|nr:CarD family transcriptional regulator [Eubacterium sp.]
MTVFEIGDYVVHGNSGVCRVEDIQEMNMGTDQKRLYYILVPLYTSGSKLFVPVDGKRVVTRSVMTKKEAQKLLEEWDEIETLLVENDKNREEIYKEALRSCDSRQWVKLIKTSYQRNQDRIKKGKKATTSDERYLHMAEDNLFGELAIPFQMTKGEVEDYFIAQVRKEDSANFV